MNEDRTGLERLEKKVFRLQLFCASLVSACALALLTGFASHKQKFGEIDVERINIVEADGKLRMVISNQKRQHMGVANGKPIERDYLRPPGIIFFNHLGDEMGGLVFGDNSTKSDGSSGQQGWMSWDKLRNDQIFAAYYDEDRSGAYETGMKLWNRPNMTIDEQKTRYGATREITDPEQRKAAVQAMFAKGELTSERLFIGKRKDNSAELVMSDIAGKPRIRMQVLANGAPKLEFLDDTGKVMAGLPEKEAVQK